MSEKITKYYSSVLRKKAEPVSLNKETKDLIKRMKKATKEHGGIGLAAPQVGESKRVIVIETGDGFTAFLNPEIIKKGKEKITTKEGCLSVDGVWLDVERAKKIKARAVNEEGEEIEVETEGILAVVLQHEIDHLDGVLFIDRVGFFKKIKAIITYYFKKYFYVFKKSR
jgi:peptide deformylase